ncbi:esterase-like activity of phytase family protein [Chromohalobacter sp. HP20-39]|uniref:esterase-like activity of phytase family protein n=1 Tax=Chromohalobacter sp. HP20-39 TaxID=3079306 RepID=UPI00294AB942|nr:esterase-like activity of phytase family protein [Chromohalobacter sp. HP20-39]MDV6318235.1 esterase-like activity of phytase family protein [Chromohalobacter sp. HP20-39]
MTLKRTPALLGLAVMLAATQAAGAADKHFNRIASFATVDNMAKGEDRTRETSAEIIDASGDGMTLAYSDSPLGVIGRIDISDPANPKPLGNIEVGGEPTAVSVIGDTVYVAVNTSASYSEPSGKLLALDIDSGKTLVSCPLSGQPDSTATAPSKDFMAIAIENERDEDAGDGRVPQMPGGSVALVDINGQQAIDCASLRYADVTGLAETAPEDPEPEFVDINAAGEIAVTLQENNHIAVLDRQGSVVSHFNAGAVDLAGIDAREDGALMFNEEQRDRLREPDALQWIDKNHFAIANEGDMDGGARGWSIFHQSGRLVYESGAAFEHAVIEAGHYPEGRSDAKGSEPEGMEFAVFDGTPYVFLLSERSSLVGVYDVSNPNQPVLTQVLPSGISPEGAVAIPGRDLLATSNETDLVADGGPRAHVMLYQYQRAPAVYPTLTSAGADELIGWGALSGMVATDGVLHAVSDSFYGAQPRIFTLDPSASPARVTAAMTVTRDGQPAQGLDMEGIAADGSGGYWIASEGNAKARANMLYHVASDGTIEREIALPEALAKQAKRWGLEGVTRVEDQLWLAVQRPWQDDPEGMAKLLRYDLDSGEWRAVHYPLANADNGWVGLSEITAHDGSLYLIERDNGIGIQARVKQLTRVALDGLESAPLGGELPVVEKHVVRDLLPDLASYNGFVVDKVEGLAISEQDRAWLVTDNDGVDDSSGETFFWSVPLK